MNEEEKQALEYFRKMNPQARHTIMAQLMFAAGVEENARKIALGLTRPGPSNPAYAMPGHGPVGAALAAEALNG